MTAVSYTHLDVYKRQPRGSLYFFINSVTSILLTKLQGAAASRFFNREAAAPFYYYVGNIDGIDIDGVSKNVCGNRKL